MREIEQVEEESNHYVDKQYRLPLYDKTSSPYQSQLSLFRNQFYDVVSIFLKHLSGLCMTEKCN